MPKFLNTDYSDAVENITTAMNDKLNNNFYKFNDKSPTKVIYYNINQEMSSIDKATGQVYQQIGESSPLRYNKITDFIVYGMNRIETNFENTDYGIESSEIVQEVYILPNSIIPTPGDYFCIDYVKQRYMFKVIDMTPDTLYNDVNCYKIEAKLDLLSNEGIEKQVVKEFKYVIENQGTNYSTLLVKDDYDIVKVLDEQYLDSLKIYYRELFFKKRVDSFILNDNGFNLYDPYLTEFIIRNNIMSTNKDYIYIGQQIMLDDDFIIDYDKTVFKLFENSRVKNIDNFMYIAQAKSIPDLYSILKTRPEPYLKVVYLDKDEIDPNSNFLSVIDDNLIDRIKYKRYYTEPNNQYKNILISYLNDADITADDVKSLEDMSFEPTKEYFYLIPLTIFVLEKFIKKLIKLT